MNKRPIEIIPREELHEAIQAAKHHTKNITRGISFDPDVWDWLQEIREDANLSMIVTQLLRACMNSYNKSEKKK